MRLPTSKDLPDKRLLLLLAVTWLALQLFLLNRYGIGTEIEARKYIDQAELLINTGNLSYPSMWLYATQILLIATAKITGAGFLAIIIFQLALNALATYFLFRLFSRLSNALTATILTLLLILNYPFQSFNSTLYTESVYYSLLILFSCYLLGIKTLTARSGSLLLVFLLVICFTRPSGLLLVPCVFIYLMAKFFSPFHFLLKSVIVAAVTILFLFILNQAIGAGGELDFMLPFKEEHIICGVPTLIENPSFTPEPNSVFGIFSYVLNHPVQFLRLAAQRTVAFFGLTRNYYSTGHNIYLAVYFFPVYILLFFSLPAWWNKNKAILFYALSFIIVTWGTVILSCDDWHNRFFLTTMPFLYLLSLPAVEILISKFRKK